MSHWKIIKNSDSKSTRKNNRIESCFRLISAQKQNLNEINNPCWLIQMGWILFFFFCLQKLINPHPAGHGGPCSVWERILSKKKEEIETNLETVGLGFWQSQAKYWFLILSSDFCKKFLKTQNTTTNSKKGIKKLKHFKYAKNKLHLITTNTNLIEFVRK